MDLYSKCISLQNQYISQQEKILHYAEERGISSASLKTFGIGYDVYSNRMTFPLYNILGDVVGFTKRSLDGSLPKYINSKDSSIFHKGELLYGLHLTKDVIAELGYCIIVEGQMDTIKMWQHGSRCCVGISGIALTESQIAILSRICNKIYLCLDNDSAGANAKTRTIDALNKFGIEWGVIEIPFGKDPDEYFVNGGTYKDLIRQVQNIS